MLLRWRKTKLRPEGPKKNWGGDQAFPPYFKVWIWHCVASVEENKTEARRAKKNWGGDRAFPSYFKVWIWHGVALVEENKTEAGRAKKKIGGGRPGPPPLFQGLDLALCCLGRGRQSGRTFNAFYD